MRSDDAAWTKEDWGNWRSRTWRTACRRAGLDEVPRPYDLRHSFASLLLAEGRTIHDVAKQLGHSPAETLSIYGHVVDEFADAERVDAEPPGVRLPRHRRPMDRAGVLAARVRRLRIWRTASSVIGPVGWDLRGHFIRDFRAVAGRTPIQYEREQHARAARP